MVLDEFDVFMDADNRQRTLQTLIGFAQDHPDMQFIMVSPQDRKAVHSAMQQYNHKQGQRDQPQVEEGFVKI